MLFIVRDLNQPNIQTPSWRTNPCQFSTFTYSVYS